ncbi:ABC transporter permease [Reticulibacter mediterranei]|uniref:ABC transporter permease n=1 Tax=Reticulibacter mediterranei TaxID=2778369 RepID=A0A8J3N5U2_9CHLR|nr:ABC transporter permease [Reticulibacter mediterranei]GHO96848.1 ABC transporter permease [Reticulibacter mediterranei]
MPFAALLTKELRSRLRRERTVWVIIVYVLLMSLLGWVIVSRWTNTSSYYYSSSGFSDAGTTLYIFLSMIQLFFILFVTPAFTSTAVNGEKERQTFELLLCSRLSSFALISGKLIAGLINALLLVAGTIPLFSLVFFFGGVSPQQELAALLLYLITALQAGTFGLLCSTIIKRPTISTVITYLGGAFWLVFPVLALYLFYIIRPGTSSSTTYVQLFFIWHPVVALISTYTPGITYNLAGIRINQWIIYTFFSALSTIVFFTLSMLAAKPRYMHRQRSRIHTSKKDIQNKVTATA